MKREADLKMKEGEKKVGEDLYLKYRMSGYHLFSRAGIKYLEAAEVASAADYQGLLVRTTKYLSEIKRLLKGDFKILW